MRSLVPYARANRLAFLPATQVIIEETTDGGTTWVSGGYTDAQKKALFATRGASIGIPLLNGAKSLDCGVRVTFTAMRYNVPNGTTETNKYQYWNSNYVASQERYSNLPSRDVVLAFCKQRHSRGKGLLRNRRRFDELEDGVQQRLQDDRMERERLDTVGQRCDVRRRNDPNRQQLELEN